MPPACVPALPQSLHRLLAICDEAGLRDLALYHLQRLRLMPLFARLDHRFDCVASRVADFVGWAEPLSEHRLAPHARHAGRTRYTYDTVRSWFLTPAAGERLAGHATRRSP
ncbi:MULTISPECIES: hypothetical protein [unclassified Paraburkholderia]|uniref:hypothetical protein n=1 Tax=unclassified Paraburkholderia TaxID=2615204 RepID=UPI001FB95DEA|nr:MULTISPECIES: hypothetical protein [unclassified Paraburkholderia]